MRLEAKVAQMFEELPLRDAIAAAVDLLDQEINRLQVLDQEQVAAPLCAFKSQAFNQAQEIDALILDPA